MKVKAVYAASLDFAGRKGIEVKNNDRTMIQPDTWYDCVITYDKTNIAIYIGGKLVAKPVPAKINDVKPVTCSSAPAAAPVPDTASKVL